MQAQVTRDAVLMLRKKSNPKVPKAPRVELVRRGRVWVAQVGDVSYTIRGREVEISENSWSRKQKFYSVADAKLFVLWHAQKVSER